MRELFFRAGAEDPSLAALIAASGCGKPAAAPLHTYPHEAA